ncbi:hypothetical protein H310_04495 [Aphanomyces invadans]|uniref:Uncharacterized protein n=1 Tax=Aphanomyces invadans TaxID=157072 RepID=A0A024UE11_9STRA|nr:hypothetical protein H310_04495 [Aphanomyces invadans]ETW04137.1 hypothetical protein H310_04495 [Aphanomyces invadans]|eukprot:XP_008867093.1 hypothetical protein H310_04495 [Aphanomyces invadans]
MGGTLNDALARLHKKHAEVQAVVNDMHSMLKLEVEEGQQRKLQMTMQQQQFERQKRKWAEEAEDLRRSIATSATVARENDAQLNISRMRIDAAQQEKAVLQETLREREQFISSVLSDKENTFKFKVQEFVKYQAPDTDEASQRKFSVDQMEQIRMASKYLDSYAADVSKAINECNSVHIVGNNISDLR